MNNPLALKKISIFLVLSIFISLNVKSQSVTWTIYNTSNSSLVSDATTSLCVDWENRLWIGAIGGLSVLKNGIWLNSSLLTGTPIHYSNMLNLWSTDDDSTVWFGTEYQSLWSYKNSVWINHQPNIGGNGIIGFVKDQFDTLWILDKFGAFAYGDSTNWTDVIPFVDHPAFLKLDSTNTIWIGSGNLGLKKYNNGTIFHYDQTSNPGLPDYIPNKSLTCLDFDTAGNMWLGTSSHGLMEYDGTNWYEYNTTTCGIPADEITALKIDASNRFWIGTRLNGIILYDGATWTNYNTTNSPLPADRIEAITCDHSGDIWVADGYNPNLGFPTGMGIVKLSPTFTSVNSTAVLSEVKSYPDPVSDFLNLNISSPVEGSIEIRVYDLSNHELFYQNQNKISFSSHLKINLKNIAPQLLILKVKLKDTVITQKIIKI